jgi:hypothetical protein
MKIALVSLCHWSNPGGMRSHIRQVAAYLRHMGHMITVVTSASAPVDESGILVVGAAFTVPFAYDFAHMVFRHLAELYSGKGRLRPLPSAQNQPSLGYEAHTTFESRLLPF